MAPFPLRNRLTVLRRGLRSAATPRGALSLLTLGGGLVVIEILGRGMSSDVGDGLLLLGLGVVFGVAGLVRGTDWEALGGRLGEAVKGIAERVSARWPTVGIDFRDDPTVLQRMPRIVVRLTVLFLAGCLFVVAWSALRTISFRALLAPRIYLVYLVAMGLLWAGLIATAALGALMGLISARHVLWTVGDVRERTLFRVLAAWFLTLLTLALVLPVEVALLFLLASILVTMSMPRLVRIPRLTLLWRTSVDGEVAATSWSTFLWQVTVLPILAVLVLLGLGLGGAWSWWPTVASTTPITDALAVIGAWLIGPALLAFACVMVYDVRRLAANDPATVCPTTVHADVLTHHFDRARLERRFHARGWRVRYAPEEPARTDVCLRLVDPPMPRPARSWPLPVSERALSVPELLDLIARRDVVQRRRILRRGLQRLLKEIRSRTYERGEGFWIAPHLWWVSAASRDTEEDDLSEDGMNSEIGPPYTHLFPLPVRHHLHVVLREVEVDIILLEDGVTWLAFRRVLDRIFEHFDDGGGRIEERHFAGVLGARVILHELEPGGSLGVEGYPEPDYEDLARGRILHVFKDRGGQDDDVMPVPTEDTNILVTA